MKLSQLFTRCFGYTLRRGVILGKKFVDKIFHILAQILFTASETELDYDHQKVSVRVASRPTCRS